MGPVPPVVPLQIEEQWESRGTATSIQERWAKKGGKDGGTAHLPASFAVINPGANEVQPDSYLHVMESSEGAALANEDITG